MLLNLPSHLRSFVDHAIAAGKYPSQEEVVLAALRQLKDQQAKAVREEWLRSEIGTALAESARGEGMDSEEFFAQLEREFPGIFDEDDADRCRSA